MDKLTVKGLGKRIDGVYDCDLTALLVDVTSPDALLVSEAETIKKLSGARGFEIAEGFLAGDWVVRMAVAIVVLARHNVRLPEASGWEAKVGAFTFDLDTSQEEETEDPPMVGGEKPSVTGGEPGSQTSDGNPESDPSATGRLVSVTSAKSA